MLSLCAKAYLESSQTFKGLSVWRFLALAENFDSVKRVGKKMILYGVFHPELFHSALNFLSCSQ